MRTRQSVKGERYSNKLEAVGLSMPVRDETAPMWWFHNTAAYRSCMSTLLLSFCLPVNCGRREYLHDVSSLCMMQEQISWTAGYSNTA